MSPGLFDRRLLIVTGKGGVGKSTVSAALALHAHRLGKRVLCCEVSAKERLAPLFGVESTGPRPARVEDGLYTVRIEAQEAMREYALMKLKFETVYNAVFENRLVRAFLRMIPSLAETVLLGKVWFEVQATEGGGPRWDLVVLDAPATGHGVSFLRVPQVLLDTVPPGALRDDAEQMHRTLTDPEITSLQLVTLPEEMPVSETFELEEQVREVLGIPLGRLFLNAHVPQRFTDSDRSRFEELLDASPPDRLSPPAAAAAAGLYQARRAELSEAYRNKLAVRLSEMPMTLLPRLYTSVWGRSEIELIAAAVAEDLGGTA